MHNEVNDLKFCPNTSFVDTNKCQKIALPMP